MILERIDDLAHGYYMARLRKPNTVRLSMPMWSLLEHEMKDRMMMLGQEENRQTYGPSWITCINTSVGMLRVIIVDRTDELLEITREWDPKDNDVERMIEYGLNTDV